jgi:hypothetical protein
LKHFWKYEDIIALNPMLDNQVFKDRIFDVEGRHEHLLIRNGHVKLKAEATDAISLLESKDYSLFIF